MDFTYLSMTCPKNPHPLSHISCLIDGSLGYHMLSCMDSYLGYIQIKMDPLHAPKATFMSNQGNYYYNVMPFDLKNAGATHQ